MRTEEEMDALWEQDKREALERRANEIREGRQWQDRRFEALSKAVAAVQAGVNVVARRQMAKKTPLAEIAIKAGIAGMVAINRRAAPDRIANQLFEGPMLDRVKAFMASPQDFVSKTYTPPAMTSDAGLSALISSGSLGLVASLAPSSTYARLRALGLRVSLEGYKSLALPYGAAGAPAGSVFVGEGEPIAVRGSTLSSVMLSPAKAALISFFTGELFSHSTPVIEAVVGTILAEDLTIGIDAALLGSSAGSAASPPGLMNGVVPIAGSPDFGADIAALVAAFDPAPSALVLIAGASAATTLGLATNQSFPWTILISDQIAPDMIIAIDAADFASAVGDDIELKPTEYVAMHTDDAAPLPISTGASGTGAITAAPVVSAWQQNLIALRILEFISWTMRRPGRIQALSGISW